MTQWHEERAMILHELDDLEKSINDLRKDLVNAKIAAERDGGKKGATTGGVVGVVVIVIQKIVEHFF